MRTKIIAEIGQAHEGSLGQAHAYINALAAMEVDVVKFQTHIAEYESSWEEPWRVPFSYEDKTRYDYWKRMEFSESQWRELKAHTEECGMEFMSTPFSVEAAQMLNELGVRSWKISSGEVSNILLMDYLIETNKPIILSTGMSGWNEIDQLVKKVRAHNIPLSLMQTTSKYPTPNSEVGLNILDEMMERYHVPVGLSNHTGEIYASLAAVARGASLTEIHVCMNKFDFGPDTVAAITVDRVKDLVAGIRAIEIMLESPINKDDISQQLSDTRKIFSKSLYAKCKIPSGIVLETEMLCARKPGYGIPVENLQSIIGKRSKRSIDQGSLLTYADIEED